MWHHPAPTTAWLLPLTGGGWGYPAKTRLAYPTSRAAIASPQASSSRAAASVLPST